MNVTGTWWLTCTFLFWFVFFEFVLMSAMDICRPLHLHIGLTRWMTPSNVWFHTPLGARIFIMYCAAQWVWLPCTTLWWPKLHNHNLIDAIRMKPTAWAKPAHAVWILFLLALLFDQFTFQPTVWLSVLVNEHRCSSAASLLWYPTIVELIDTPAICLLLTCCAGMGCLLHSVNLYEEETYI